MTDKNDQNAGPPLGTRSGIYIGVTLNYGDNFRFKVDGRLMAWSVLRLTEQRLIYIDHLKEHYVPLCERVDFTFELTKAGQLHCHALLYLDDTPTHTEYWVASIRKDIARTSGVIRMTKGKRGLILRSNYIHAVEPERWIGYMLKDIDKTPFKLQTITRFIEREG